MNEALQVAGCIAAAAAICGGMLLPDRRLRAAAVLAALALALALLLGEGWDELSSLRDRPAALGVLALAGAAALVGLALALRRWPDALPPLLVATLPFRIPIDVSGEEVNLLLPLYVVIAAGGNYPILSKMGDYLIAYALPKKSAASASAFAQPAP